MATQESAKTTEEARTARKENLGIVGGETVGSQELGKVTSFTTLRNGVATATKPKRCRNRIGAKVLGKRSFSKTVLEQVSLQSDRPSRMDSVP